MSGVESAADQLGYLSPWGDSAVFGTGTSAITVVGIFDDKFEMVDELGLHIESSEPQFECRTSDVATVTNGEQCVINSVTYQVTTLEADGTGMTLVTLHKA